MAAVVATAFPDADTSDPTWVVVDGKDYSIEVSIPNDDEVLSVMLYVRGETSALEAIERLCEVSRWRALDGATGQFIDFRSEDRDVGMRRWLDYQEHVRRGHVNADGQSE